MSTSNKSAKRRDSKAGVGGKKIGPLKNKKSVGSISNSDKTMSFPEPKRSSLKVICCTGMK